MNGVKLTAVGKYVPERKVTNFDLSEFLDTSDEWIKERTGISSRHIADQEENTSILAFKAVENIIENYPNAINDVDYIIVATNSADAVFVSTASLIQHRFSLPCGGCDLTAACSSWVYALTHAVALVRGGIAHKILVVGVDRTSKLIDWQDRSTAILFGDGAGAAIVESSEKDYFLAFDYGSDGSEASNLAMKLFSEKLPDGNELNSKVKMNGRAVYRFSTHIIVEMIKNLVNKSQIPIEEYLFIPHQANIRIIESAARELNLTMDKFFINLDKYGNTSAATVPIALAEAKINPNSPVMVLAFGGGLAWSGAAFIWTLPN